MKITSILFDKKIMGINVAVELTIEEYFKFAGDIIDENQLQRRKVKTAGKTYDLLRHDLVHGCVIPPIVLATTDDLSAEVSQLISDYNGDDGSADIDVEVSKILNIAIKNSSLMILDGLQRTLTMASIIESKSQEFALREVEAFTKRTFRFEVYLGLSKPGILYRMLTLNTGQTPMSFRHQLEILYNDYIDRDDLPGGISIFRESDEKRARGPGKYKYSDVVDMFYAFSTESPMPYGKGALVAELKEMDFLESYEFKPGADEMGELLVLFNKFVDVVEQKSNGWNLDKSSVSSVERPFGTSVQGILARPQCMTGFGAECKRLIRVGAFKDMAEISNAIDTLEFSNEVNSSLRSC